METNINKTKVIDNYISTIKYESVSKSYRWEEKSTKNTFTPDLWVNAITDLVYNGLSTSEIEKKYVNLMAKVRRPSHGMYINSLLKKTCLDNKQNSEKIRGVFTEKEISTWIKNRIQKITNSNYENATKKAKEWINEWRSYLKLQESNSCTQEELRDYLKLHKDRSITWNKIQIPDVDNTQKINLNKIHLSENTNSQEQSKKIGSIGEKIFYDQLVNKYGIDNVEWTSNYINENSPYDFKVEYNNESIYFEVKSTSKNYMRFFLSRNEYEFWKTKPRQYRLITIKNIIIHKNSSLGVINEVENPEFEIDMDYWGTKNGKIIISPSKFKGMI